QGRPPHRQYSCKGQQQQIHIAERLPQAHQQSEHHAEEMHGGLHVVAEEFRIAEGEASLQIMISVPQSQGNNWKNQSAYCVEAGLALRVMSFFGYFGADGANST